MFHRLRALIIKEITQFSRDRILVIFAFLGPALQIMLLGNAISIDVQNLEIAVLDYDRSPLSREIITALDNTVELAVIYYPENLEAARALVDRGEAIGVMVIPPGFQEESLNRAEAPEIQVFLDGSSSFVAGRALTAAAGAVQGLVDEALVTSNPALGGGVRVYPEALFNRALDFRPDAITSQMALITFQMVSLVAVMGIVRERDIGTMEMLNITPLRRLELIAGKAITPLIIGLFNFLIMFTVTQLVFGVPQRGSFALLLAITVLYLASEIGYALLISTIAGSQQQAVTVIFIWAMLAMMLSGYLVPISTLPRFLQWVSVVIPLRHYLTVVRGIMLKGAGIGPILPEVGILALITVVGVWIATRTLSRVSE